MAELVAKLPLGSLALILGTLFLLLSVMSQVSTKWFVVNLNSLQRVLLAMVGIGLMAMAFLPKAKACEDTSRCLPVVRFPLVEKAEATALLEPEGELFLRAREIHRYVDPGDVRPPFVELEYGASAGLLPNTVNIYPGKPSLIALGSRQFQLSYVHAGKLDRPGNDPNGQAIDVMLINVERVHGR